MKQSTWRNAQWDWKLY